MNENIVSLPQPHKPSVTEIVDRHMSHDPDLWPEAMAAIQREIAQHYPDMQTNDLHAIFQDQARKREREGKLLSWLANIAKRGSGGDEPIGPVIERMAGAGDEDARAILSMTEDELLEYAGID